MNETNGIVENSTGRLGALSGVLKGGLVAGVGVAVGGLAALGAGLYSAVGEAMAAEEVTAQLNAVLASTGGIAGVTADMATGLADSLSGVTRFEDDAILSGENLLLTFTNIGSDVFPQATETMLDMSQALGQDLKSSAVQLGKALNDPVQGMSALSRVGVSFTESQKEQITALQESGDLLGAQTIILQELEREFGGAAVAAGQTFGGQLDILKNQLGNVKEGVGNALLPALTSLAQALGPMLITAVSGLATWLTSNLVPALQGLFEWIAVNLPPAIAALANFWTTVLQPALAAVWSFISGSVIPILQQVFSWLAENIPPALQTLANFWTTVLQPALAAVWSFIQTSVIPVLITLLTWLRDNIPPALQTLANFWTTVLQPALAAVWSFIQTSLVPLLRSLANVVIVLLKKELELLAAIWQNVLQPALQVVWSFIQENVLPILLRLADFVSETLGPALSWFKNNVLDPVAGAFGSIGDAISTVIGWLDGLASKLGAIKLPSWLQPGSPTPFELGLLGINAALQDTIHLMERLPSPAAPGIAAVGYGGTRGAMAAFAPAAAGQWNVTIHVNGGTTNAETGRAVEQGVLRAARLMGLR